MEKDKEKGFETFLRQMRVMAIDESGNTYDADNPASSAIGKYQYLWSVWSDKIKEKAKQWGEEIGTEEEFKANSVFQEKFFEWDQKNAYKEVQELAEKDNKLNLSTADFGVMRHRYGSSKVKEIAKKGELPKAQYKDGKLLNPSAAVMLNSFRKNLATNGIPYNDGHEKNYNRAKNLPLKEKREIQKKYDTEIEKINKASTDPLIINSLKQELAKKFYADGNLEVVNQRIDYQNKRYDRFDEINPPFEVKYKDTDPDYPHFVSKEARATFKKTYEAERENQRKSNVQRNDGTIGPPLSPTQKEQRWNLNNFKMDEPAPIVDNSAPEPDAKKTDGNSNGSSTADNSAKTTPTAPAVIAKLDDPLDAYNSQTTVENEQFNYEKGKFQLPFEALADAAMGLAGVAAANTKIPYRDEQVSAGMLNYAADLAKISKIGLPPEIEGDLKMKLANAYQTGLTNIVRASAGNRNLVLGNQGQLDEARMHGIAEIATLDLDRRDKAMAAYGEVQKYINEFDTRRDVANKELDQEQAKMKQQMGMTVAAQGFSKLIENINYQKEFGPGSVNDMMSQAWLTNIYGYNPAAKDDGTGTKVGTKSYADKLVTDRKAKDAEGEKYKNWLLTLKPEERQQVAKMQEQNPSLSPIKNRDGFKANSLIEAFGNKPADTSTQAPVQDAITPEEKKQNNVPAIVQQQVPANKIDTSSYDSGAWKNTPGIPLADISEINVSTNGTSKMPNVPQVPTNTNDVRANTGSGYNPTRDGLGSQTNATPIVNIPQKSPQEIEVAKQLHESYQAIDLHLKANEDFDKYFNQNK